MLRWTVLSLVCAVSVAACSGQDGQPPAQEGPEDSRFGEAYVITEDSVQLYARIVGHGPDTVVIPSAVYLARDLTPLASGRTLIFYDPRGRGGSDFVRDTTRIGMEWEQQDIESVRSHFNIDQMSLIGWSYLGAVVVRYAADHPGRVRRVVQIGPMPARRELAEVQDQRGSPPDSVDLARLAELERAGLREADPMEYCRQFTRIRLIRPMMGRPEAAEGARMDPCMYWNEWPTQLSRMIRHLLPDDWDYRAAARRVNVPVLTIHGTDDPNAPVEGGREWASVLPDARLVEFQGVGHAPWLEAPDRFFTEVDQFLSGG